MSCTKTKYASERFALEDLKRIKANSTRGIVPQKTYLCPKCNFWHLTSQNDERNEQIKELLHEISNLKNKNKNLEYSLSAIKKQLQQASSELSKDNTIKQLHNQINEKNRKIKRLKLDYNNMIAKTINSESKLNLHKI